MNDEPERHKDRKRNLILNRTVPDLDEIVNQHDPEVHVPINDGIWDRLDKMALEIEAHTHADLIAKADELAKAVVAVRSAKRLCEASKSYNDPRPEQQKRDSWRRKCEIRMDAALSAYTQVREGK